MTDIERTNRQRKNPDLPNDKAERSRSMLINLFVWATLRGYCTKSPTQPIASVKASHLLIKVTYGKRPALVKPSEFARLMADIFNDTSTTPDTRHNLLLLAYTGVINDDIRAMQWADIDLQAGKWELTPLKGKSHSKIKMVDKMTLPLSRQVIAILQEQHRLTGAKPYVFAKDNKNGYISDGATNDVLNRLGY